jgi:hypothetical protein
MVPAGLAGAHAAIRAKTDEEDAWLRLQAVCSPETFGDFLYVAEERARSIERSWATGIHCPRRLDDGFAYETPLAAAYRSVTQDIMWTGREMPSLGESQR